jgi:hypothetical protein
LTIAAVCAFSTTSAKQSAYACLGIQDQVTIHYFHAESTCGWVFGHWTCTIDYVEEGTETYYCDGSYSSIGDVNPADAAYTTETDTHCPPCHPGE